MSHHPIRPVITAEVVRLKEGMLKVASPPYYPKIGRNLRYVEIVNFLPTIY